MEPKPDTPDGTTITQIIKLKYVDCESVAEKLTQLFPEEQFIIVPDKRTNMLLVNGTESAIEKIIAIITAIDVLVDETVKKSKSIDPKM